MAEVRVEDAEVEGGLVQLDIRERIEQPIAVRGRMVQLRGNNRRPVLAAPCRRIVGAVVGRAVELHGQVAPKLPPVERLNDPVGRELGIADVPHIEGPYVLVTDPAEAQLSEHDGHSRPRRVGLRERHVWRDRTVDEAPVHDLDAKPHLAQRDGQRLEARHLRPQARACDRPGGADQAIEVRARCDLRVTHIGLGVVQRRELDARRPHHALGNVTDAPRCTTHRADLLLEAGLQQREPPALHHRVAVPRMLDAAGLVGVARSGRRRRRSR